MLNSAEFTREVQRRAKDEYEKYCKLKEEISQVIMFASCIGQGKCDFEIKYSQMNRRFIEKVSNELIDLGYSVNRVIAPSVLRLNIAW